MSEAEILSLALRLPEAERARLAQQLLQSVKPEPANGTAPPTKERVIESVRELPESATVEEIVEHVLIVDAIRQGQADIRAGRVIRHDEMRRRVAQWLAK
jgi:hypothetical protein